VKPVKDVQRRRDRRGIEIDMVGVRDIRYPIMVLDKAHGVQHTIAKVNMYVKLPHRFKGTHMSRFIEVLNLYRNEINIKSFPSILGELKRRLNAKTAHVEFTFPYFIRKAAPVSGQVGLMEYGCKVHGFSDTNVRLVAEVRAPVTTLCPCSKEISERGAHNQRGNVTVAVTFNSLIWFEDLIRMIEQAGSCEIYSLLKREDEKFVTERAYRHPKFVEDVVREVAAKLLKDPKITWFSVSAESQESIHNHNAYAYVEREKVKGARPR
jgi:GTP cyclohydrolase I